VAAALLTAARLSHSALLEIITLFKLAVRLDHIINDYDSVQTINDMHHKTKWVG